MRRLLKVVLGSALVLGATAAAVAPSRAEVSISITPSLVEIGADAGGDGTVDIVVGNRGDETFTAAVTVIAYPGADGDLTAIDWLSVSPDQVVVEPGATATVQVTVEVPDGLASGGRYAAVAFNTGAVPSDDDQSETSDEQSASLAVSGAVVVPVRIAVQGTGDLTVEPIVERFAAVLEPDGRVGFRAEVRNDGNVHAKLTGNVEVTETGEDPLASLEFADATILPGETKLLTTRGTLPLPEADRYGAEATLTGPGGSEDGKDSDDPLTASAEFGLEPALTLAPSTVCENLDRGPTFAGAMENGGDLGLMPSVQFEIRDANGRVQGSTAPAAMAVAWPHDTLAFTTSLAERPVTGTYTVITRVMYGGGATIEQETTFSIGGDPATAIPLCENPTLD